MHRLLILFLLPLAVSAQPRLSDVGTGDQPEWDSGVTVYISPQSNPDVTYLRWGPNATAPAVAVVDGRRTTLRPVGRGRTESAFDRDAGVTRTYAVSTFRSADRAVEVELWLREIDDDGGDCLRQVGGMTVRKRGQSTHVRVHAAACQF